MPLETNFNISPYFDDYDETKKYYKILFRPSVAVQARELNQLQTILQKQIDRFGQHIFREGSIVLGGAFDPEYDVAYVKATSFAPASESPNNFVGKIFAGVVSGVTGYCRAYTYDVDNGLHVFFIRYTAGSDAYSQFIDGEQVIGVTDTNLSFTAAASSATGLGSIFSISSGVMFSKGYFIYFPSQTVVLDKYSTTPSVTAGLYINTKVITELNDPTLNDNAQGYFNEGAPGAHRYFIDPVLEAREYDYADNDENFIPLLRINNGIVEKREERTLYSRIYDELAKRTFDESGDYFVRGFGVRTRDHLDNGTNEGYLTASEGGDATKISVDFDPGLAYVKGYEVNKLTTSHVVIDKSTANTFVNSQKISARSGGYFSIKEVVGSISRDEGTIVNLYDAAETRITSKTPASTAPSGNVIGTARVKHVEYSSGTLGRATAEMLFYFSDLNMTGGVFADVRGIGISGTFFADLVLIGGEAVIQQDNENISVFYVGSNYTRTIRNESGNPDTIFDFYRTESKTIDFGSGGGQFTVSVSVTNEEVAFGDGVLTDAEKRQLFVTANSAVDIQLPGTVSGTTGASNITGTSTTFTNLSVGDKIKIGGNLYYINSISNATFLVITGTLSTSPSANLIYRSFTVGDYIDLTANGSSGVERTANVSSGVLTIDLKEDTTYSPSNIGCKISYPVERTSASEVNKLLRANRYVKIRTANNAANTVGPYVLGLSDVYNIRSVRMHTADFTTGTEGSNVTSSFVLDINQTDNSYEHSRIRHVGSLDLSSKYLLVELDHFETDFSSGFGYFSVDSYPINDSAASNTSIFTYDIPSYTSSTGVLYNLRDCLDFRPYKTATANSSTTLAGATINPVTSNTFQTGDSNGLRSVTPGTNIIIDYSYYLARRDGIGLNKDGEFEVVRGVSAVSPITPTISDKLMAMATVYVAPYPSITETLARIENINQNICTSTLMAQPRYTMRDIGVIKNRVDNLEYYSSLNLLEKSASDLSILDESGLDRFKNGFFVDGFLDHSLGATSNRDYNISVDKESKLIRPVFDMDSFKLQFANGQSQYQTGSLLGTTYSEAVLIDQPRATTKRNIEQSVFRFIGVLDLAPDNDNWVDIKTVDKTFEFGNDIPANNAMTTTWGSWQSSVTGKSVYKVYERKAGDRQEIINGTERLIGTFTSYAEAVRATRTVTRAKIEVVSSSTSTRTGTHTTTSVQDQTETLGNFVTDVNIQPYIRPQTIFIRARGVKARTRFYVYFDGENMSSYVTPLNQYPITIQDINASTIPIVTPDIFTGAEGGSLISDDYGIVNFALRLPKDGKRFRTGTKEIIVTDSPTNAVDATTYAKGYFVSNGLSVNKQNTIVSTKVVVVNETQLSETKTNNNPQKVEIFGPSCMAYSFKIDAPINEPGVFLTSAEIYIAAVHPTLGVWFEIREMNSGGNITRTQVPYSEVWYTSAQIQPYLNPEKPTTPFKVTFPSPVFLQNDTQYAFVIHTEGLNPDTYFWVSRLGETDVNSGKQVVGRQLTGTLFTTNNNLNYDIVPDVDLTIKFNRADFFLGGTSPVTTQIVMGNSPVEFMTLTANSDSFIYSGETILGSDRLSLANVQGTNTISVGDYITGANSAVNAEVIAISSPYYYTTGISYSNGESISVYASNGSNKSINAIISSVEGGRGVLRNYSNTSNLMVLDQTNGKYFANAAIKGVQSNSVGRISSFSNQKYSVLNFKDHSLSLGNTSVSYEHRAYIASSNSYGDWQDLLPDTSELYDTEYTILSRSNEVVSLSGNTSTQIRATITTNTPWLSPIIDFSRCNAVFVRNILNNDTTGEDGVSGGNLTNKYISKTITLADGQDAEDILVKLTSYRPPNTDVKMWVKIRHAEDPQTIDEKSWSLMNYNESLFSSSANRNDFIEFDYTFPTSMMSNGVVYYVSNSVTFTGFKQFAIKIGLMGTDAANPPKVTDLRAIALQK